MGLSEFFGCVLPARPAREFSPKEERLGLGERGYSMVLFLLRLDAVRGRRGL